MHRTAFLSMGFMLLGAGAASSAVAQEDESKPAVTEPAPQLVAPENVRFREVPVRDSESSETAVASPDRAQTVVRFTDSKRNAEDRTGEDEVQAVNPERHATQHHECRDGHDGEGHHEPQHAVVE